MLRSILLTTGFLLIFSLAGCEKSSTPPTGSTTTKSESEKTATSENPTATSDPAKSLAWPGLWRIEMTDEGIIHDFGVININEDSTPGKFTVRTQALSENYDAANLREGSVDGDKVHLIYDGGPDLEFQIVATRTPTDVKGYMLVKKLHLSTIRMIKVESDILDSAEGGVPMEGNEIFSKLASTTEGEDGIRDFVQQYPDNPVILRAYEVLAGFAAFRKAPPEDIEKIHQELVQQAARWGAPVAARADLELASFLARMGEYNDLALKFLTEFQKQITPDSPAGWNLDLAISRTILGQHQEVIDQLKPFVTAHPDDYKARFTLAFAYEKNNQNDLALEEYLRLAVLPFMDQILNDSLKETKSDSLMTAVTRLWTAKHGNAEGLPAAIDELYVKETQAVIPPREDKPELNPKSRAVLVELFTGTGCPPCIAADLSVSGLELRYPAPEVVVLRHHMHIPAPDPFALEGGETRFRNYVTNDPFFQQHPEAVGTPTVAINGTIVSGVNGVELRSVKRSYDVLTSTLSGLLRQETDLKLNVSATRAGDKIQVSAQAEGSELSENLRLYLLLVENDIHFVAPNGIRIHDAVVRSYINGNEGSAPADGKLQFSTELSLPEVATDIKKSIAKLEERFGRVFAVPPTLDKLQIVAFVQDNATREILQAAVVTPESPK